MTHKRKLNETDIEDRGNTGEIARLRKELTSFEPHYTWRGYVNVAYARFSLGGGDKKVGDYNVSYFNDSKGVDQFHLQTFRLDKSDETDPKTRIDFGVLDAFDPEVVRLATQFEAQLAQGRYGSDDLCWYVHCADSRVCQIKCQTHDVVGQDCAQHYGLIIHPQRFVNVDFRVKGVGDPSALYRVTYYKEVGTNDVRMFLVLLQDPSGLYFSDRVLDLKALARYPAEVLAYARRIKPLLLAHYGKYDGDAIECTEGEDCAMCREWRRYQKIQLRSRSPDGGTD